MVKGRLTTILICIVMGLMAYLSMFAFYTNMVTKYTDTLNFTIDDSFNSTYIKMNETLGIVGGDMTVMHQNYLDESSGTQTTASDTMIIRSFKMIKSIMGLIGKLVTEVIPDIATKLHIPPYWVTGFISILLIVILIVVVAGFFKITTW